MPPHPGVSLAAVLAVRGLPWPSVANSRNVRPLSCATQLDGRRRVHTRLRCYGRALRHELNRYDEEMRRRANEAYERDNPEATTRPGCALVQRHVPPSSAQEV